MSGEIISFAKTHERADQLIASTETKRVVAAVYFDQTFTDSARREYLVRMLAEIVNKPEPTAAEIRSALQQCFDYCEMVPAQRKPMLAKLRELRDRKFSWIGEEENRLRSEVDQYLRSMETIGAVLDGE